MLRLLHAGRFAGQGSVGRQTRCQRLGQLRKLGFWAGEHSALQTATGLRFCLAHATLLSDKNEFINVSSDITRPCGRMPKQDQKQGLGETWSDCPDASRGFYLYSGLL